ncbi:MULTISPECIES: helix-turn-helix domain-containing protein [unclassified Cryobacterium]|uniref:helix-turn-helix domain-containing protein n=1 Tax=unclassified Cryobacterium TaxID=2649013 RepID=UPI0034DD0CF8
MDTERLFGLGLEPVLTTSELAEYLGVHVQAIYDLRTDGRGPSGILGRLWSETAVGPASRRAEIRASSLRG